jgi:type I restriction enzyme, S subunit
VIADLKPYAEYKESGSRWLAEVPSHWEVRRTKTILREVDRRSLAGSEPLLSLRMQSGLVDHHALGGKLIPPSALVGYKRVLPGEIVMNRMRAAAGLFAAATSEGLVSPDYAIFRPTCQMRVAYAVQLFRTPAMTSVFRLESRGLGTGESGFLRLYSDRFGMLPVPFPPIEEQAAIVRFLDWVNGRLERAIRAKRKVIALLTEQKQAIIHRAVTRGLDPSVPLKPSGISWLGDIPQHWSLRRFKFLATINSGQVDPRKAAYRDLVLLAPNHIESGSGRLLAQETAAEQGADSGKYLVSRGQVVYSKIRPNLRKATIAPCDCLCSADMYPIAPKTGELSAEYLLLLLLSQSFTKFAVDASMRVAMPKVNRESLADCPLWFPSVVEQTKILDFVGRESAPIENAITRLDREIELLREYRTRLAADVVTGKLDVREVAARLPEEAAPDTAEDVADWSDEAEPSDEEAAV